MSLSSGMRCGVDSLESYEMGGSNHRGGLAIMVDNCTGDVV